MQEQLIGRILETAAVCQFLCRLHAKRLPLLLHDAEAIKYFAPTYKKLLIGPGKKRFIDPLQERRRAHAGPLRTRLDRV